MEAGELGFEPRQADPESAVLPLHHSPKDFFKLGGLENGVKIKGPVGEIQNPKSEKRNKTTKHTNDTKEKENSSSSFV